MIVTVRVSSGFKKKNPRVGNCDWDVEVQDTHGNVVRDFRLRNKDERLRKEHIQLCKAVLLVYFSEDLKKLEKPGDSVYFQDRGFFKKFPINNWR